MIEEQTLERAVERGLLTADQVRELRLLEQSARIDSRPPPVDDEALRFVTGFADIFVTIGIGLFTGALLVLAWQRIGPTIASGAVAASAWLLAEFFTRRRRMSLPSIVLLLIFVTSIFKMLTAEVVFHGPSRMIDNAPILIVAGCCTLLAAVAHYLRFRVPITIAAGAMVLGVVLLGVVFGIAPRISPSPLHALVLAYGILVFAVAMRFDLADPARTTRRTDIAFWLHLLAAPLIVHTLVRGFFHFTEGEPTPSGALAVLGVFAVLGLVAIVVDRRAILVSGLVYAGIAFGAVIKTFGFTGSGVIPAVLLALGAFILLISAGWHPLRGALLRLLPAALARRLPHPLNNGAS